MFSKNKIKLDPDLYEKAKALAAKRGYASVEEFVTHLVEGALAAEGGDDPEGDVKDRLSGLGYIS